MHPGPINSVKITSSPGGMTQAGLDALEEHRLRDALRAAVAGVLAHGAGS